MSDKPKEPVSPPGTKPHRQRVKDIDGILPEGKTAGIVIDEEHKDWYLSELTRYPRLTVEWHGVLSSSADGVMYLIKVLKGPSLN